MTSCVVCHCVAMYIHGKTELNQVGEMKTEAISVWFRRIDGISEKQVGRRGSFKLSSHHATKTEWLNCRLEALGINCCPPLRLIRLEWQKRERTKILPIVCCYIQSKNFEPAELFLKRLMDIAGLVGNHFHLALSIFVVLKHISGISGPLLFLNRTGSEGSEDVFPFTNSVPCTWMREERKKSLWHRIRWQSMFKNEGRPQNYKK